jgi:putative transposase
MYIKVEGLSVTLPTGGKGNKNKRYPDVIAKLTEEAPPDYKDVAISRDGQGHYYASFVHEEKESMHEHDGVLAIDLGIKTLATGVNEQGRIYHVGGFKGHRWYNKQLDKIRSKRDRCKKKSRRYIHLSKVYKRVSQKKRNKQRDSLHKASHLISHTLVERTVVVEDLSHRAVFNDWGLYSFVQMLRYKCVLYGKELAILDERDTSKMCSSCGKKQAMPLYKRTYRCANTECRLVMDRDENSAVNILKRYLARLGPHTGDPVRYADVFTATDHVNTFEHM